jgi:hypothetical protein
VIAPTLERSATTKPPVAQLAKVGFVTRGKRDRSLVVEQGALVAEHLLTMAIRAIDYCPPTDLTFSDLSLCATDSRPGGCAG